MKVIVLGKKLPYGTYDAVKSKRFHGYIINGKFIHESFAVKPGEEIKITKENIKQGIKVMYNRKRGIISHIFPHDFYVNTRGSFPQRVNYGEKLKLI